MRKNNTKSHRSGEDKLIEKMAKNIIRKRNAKEGDLPMSVSTLVDFVFSSENHAPCSPYDYLDNCLGQTFKRDCPSVYPPIRLSVCHSVGSSVRPTVRPTVRFGSSVFRSFSCPKMSRAKNNEKQNKLEEAIREKIKVLRSLRNKKRTSPAHGTHQFSCDFSDNSTFSRNESNNHANENHFDTKSGFKPSQKQLNQAMKKIKKFHPHWEIVKK